MPSPVKVVICREDLPYNPRWAEEGYPYGTCWDIDEFMRSKRVPYEEKRRIFWESYWRALGRYRRGRPFFDVYIVENNKVKKFSGGEKQVLAYIVSSAFAHGVAKTANTQLYSKLFGQPFSKP